MIYFLNLVHWGYTRILRKYFKIQYSYSLSVLLENNFKYNFSFVQIGANDGISFDNLFDFVVARNSSGIVVEPVHEYFVELVKNYENYPNIIKVNKAIHPIEKKIIINKIASDKIFKYPDWVKGIASIDSLHHLKTGIASEDIVKEEVDADTLMNVLKDNLVDFSIDYFQVDAEGFDYEILKQIDFNICKPTIIKFEFVNLTSQKRQKLKLFLKKQNYYLFDDVCDTIALDFSKVKIYL